MATLTLADFRLGDHVEFVADPRISGRVVGFGSVDNSVDPKSTDKQVHDVVIVSLDRPSNVNGTLLTHDCFVPAVLKKFYM